ncbi:MAG: rhodanese-like domain-containing protein [Gammaproteobacteria bacterium]|nr:rhodanese-like domain-containing protein [Gammaproteobacteria bacterium]
MDAVKDISVNDLADLLKTSEVPVQLLDVRTVAEMSQGIIPGALLASPANMGLAIEYTGITVIYCRSGIRSAHVCRLLTQQGCGHVLNLRHGIIAWAGAGLSITRPDEGFFS